MNKLHTKQSYQQRLERVVDYISQHLDQDLEVNQLAEVAHFSPYHFHRIYREMLGEPVNATVRRYRLHHAAHALISTEQPILTIAKNVCYGSVEAFSRAFSKAYGFTPAQYRKQRKTHCFLEAEPSLPQRHVRDMMMFTIEMMNLPEMRVIGLEHQGDYLQIGHKFDQLFMQAGTLGLLNENTYLTTHEITRIFTDWLHGFMTYLAKFKTDEYNKYNPFVSDVSVWMIKIK